MEEFDDDLAGSFEHCVGLLPLASGWSSFQSELQIISLFPGTTMKRLTSRYGGFVPIAALALAAVAEGIIYAGPCYQTTQPETDCWSQGGPKCTVINPVPNDPCPGGPWTLSDLSEQGLPTNACQSNLLDDSTPVNNDTSGNESSGTMSQGSYSIPCTDLQSCTWTNTSLVPLTYECVASSTTCSYITLFTIGGGTCPPPPK